MDEPKQLVEKALNLHGGFRMQLLVDWTYIRFIIDKRRREEENKYARRAAARAYNESLTIGPGKDPRWRRAKRGWECDVDKKI